MSQNPQQGVTDQTIPLARDCQLALRVKMDASGKIRSREDYSPPLEAQRMRDAVQGEANTPVSVLFDPGLTYILFGTQQVGHRTIMDAIRALLEYESDAGGEVQEVTVVTVYSDPAGPDVPRGAN